MTRAHLFSPVNPQHTVGGETVRRFPQHTFLIVKKQRDKPPVCVLATSDIDWAIAQITALDAADGVSHWTLINQGNPDQQARAVERGLITV
jgi:hypothetical protein